MRSIDETFETFGKRVLWLGYAGEEDRSTLIVDLHDILLEFPGATAVLKVRPPDEKAAYPAITETIDDKLHWSISDSDTAKEGRGELQLSLISPTGSKIKTAVAAMEISRSLPDGGQKPDRIDDWMEKAEAARKKAEEAATKADTATTKANEATSKANTAASNADTATIKTNEATSKANTAASNADTKANLANDAATKADTATNNANTATTEANEAATKATDAAKRAEDAAEKADKARQNILIGSEMGNPVSVSDAFSAPLCGLTVYGRSTQDGTPSPDNPAPIVSAGDGGTITVTIGDGADERQTITLQTPNGLPGISVRSGGNYTDPSGQQWVCDEVDLERKVKVQRVKAKELSPDDKWTYQKLSSGNNNFQTRIYGKDVSKNSFPSICNILPFKNVIWNDNIQNLPKIYANNQEITVSFPPSSEYSSLEVFKQLLTNVKSFIFYCLATPIETPLTPAEISAYKALTTYAPNTVVQASDGAGVKLAYQRDVNIAIKKLEDAIASMTTT